MPEDRAIFERTRQAAQLAKEALSEELEYDINIDGVVETGLSRADIQQKVTRARFLALIGPLIERAVETARKATHGAEHSERPNSTPRC